MSLGRSSRSSSPQVFGGIVASVRKRYEEKDPQPTRRDNVSSTMTTINSPRIRREKRGVTAAVVGVAKGGGGGAAGSVRVPTTPGTARRSSARVTPGSVTCASVAAAPLSSAAPPLPLIESSSLLRQPSDSGVSISSSLGAPEEDHLAHPDALEATEATVVELTSAKLKELDEFNKQVIAELASSRSNSLLDVRAGADSVVTAEALELQIKDDANWRTAWKELAGVTPSRRLLQLMRKLQAKWSSSGGRNASEGSAVAHVTVPRADRGGAALPPLSSRPFLKGSALLDSSQKVAVASPSGALVASSNGGSVKAYVNTRSLAELKKDLLKTREKNNELQERDLVICVSSGVGDGWRPLDNVSRRPSMTQPAPMRPLRHHQKSRGDGNQRQLPPSPQVGRRNPSAQNTQVARKQLPPTSPQVSRRQAPASPQMPRKQLPSTPDPVRSRPQSPLPLRKSSSQQINPKPSSSNGARIVPSSPGPSRRSSMDCGPQVIKVQQPITNSPLSTRSVDSRRVTPGLPRPGLVQSPREQVGSPAMTRGRCPQAKSALHNQSGFRTARSQTRDSASRTAQPRGSSQPPQRNGHATPVSISSKLRDDVLAAFGVRLNGVSRTLPRTATPQDMAEFDNRKHSLDSNSSGISGCSQDSLNRSSPSISPRCEPQQPETVSVGMGYSPHAHLHSQVNNCVSPWSDEQETVSTNGTVLLGGPHCHSLHSNDHYLYPPDNHVGANNIHCNRRRSNGGGSSYNDFSCGSSSASSTVSSNVTSKSSQQKKHKSRVHVGGSNDSSALPPDVQLNNAINNNVHSNYRPYKATTISINMGPVIPDTKKHSNHHIHSRNSPHSASRISSGVGKQISVPNSPSLSKRSTPRQPPSLSSKYSSPNKNATPRQSPSMGRQSVSATIAPPASQNNSRSSSKNGSRQPNNSKSQAACEVRKQSSQANDERCSVTAAKLLNQNGVASTTSSRRGSKNSCSNGVPASKDNRTHSTIVTRKEPRGGGAGRKECALSRADNKPVSRLVRQGTFRITADSRGADGQEIMPSIRLRYLMQRANSHTNNNEEDTASSVPSSPEIIHRQHLQVRSFLGSPNKNRNFN